MRLDELSDDRVLITEEDLYEMARVKPGDSGLKCTMYASTKAPVKGRHGPRIKISNVIGTFSESDNFVVTVSREPALVAGKCKFRQSELEEIFDWVKLNHDALVKYWEDSYESDRDFYDDLTKI